VTEPAQFHNLYNQIVHDYRRRHGIRSRNHPVPDLAAEGEWLELPFWGWRADRPRRQGLLVRRIEGRYELRAGREFWGQLPGSAQYPEALNRAWREREA